MGALADRWLAGSVSALCIIYCSRPKVTSLRFTQAPDLGSEVRQYLCVSVWLCSRLCALFLACGSVAALTPLADSEESMFSLLFTCPSLERLLTVTLLAFAVEPRTFFGQ